MTGVWRHLQLLIIVLLPVFSVIPAGAEAAAGYHLIKNISVPGNGGWLGLTDTNVAAQGFYRVSVAVP